MSLATAGSRSSTTRISIHPAGNPEYLFDPLGDGDEVNVGDVALRVMHTPGHRPSTAASR